MYKIALIISSISGFLAVSIGAFGAHALKSTLEKTGHLATFQTGSQYHFIHTLAIFALAFLIKAHPESKYLHWSVMCFSIGILLFSGSLYALSVSGLSKLGAITPIGGLLFIAGWLLILVFSYKL